MNIVYHIETYKKLYAASRIIHCRYANCYFVWLIIAVCKIKQKHSVSSRLKVG